MKKLYHFAFYLILLFAPILISAQSFKITGKITDAESGESMIGVHITIAGEVYGTISNYDGSFVLTTQTPPRLICIFRMLVISRRI